MSKKIYIDARHPEELRVALCQNNKLIDFAYHNSKKQSLKGDIYLAKVTRVEPSLQAVFLDFGGGRHGFMPYTLINPYCFDLSGEAKKELRAMLKAIHESNEVEESDFEDDSANNPSYRTKNKITKSENRSPLSEIYKKYKIQDVIKKEQVLLVQIVKEERGNKGATLTTYLTLSGRYFILMPNSNKASGISKRIDDLEEKQRLREFIKECQDKIPNSAILARTGAAYKTKAELKRDFGYLSRLWTNISKHAESAAPTSFIYEDGDLIKRSIRDLYDGEVESIIIEGERAFQETRDFMQTLLPRHIDKVQQHQSLAPIFHHYAIEGQIAALYENTVPLNSGGYLVINQTEALVSIDINSGKSNRESTIENTALKTNLEAVEEIARQIKLRDLSGLIVIDFIDMAGAENKSSVEKAVKIALSNDRVKTQCSKISQFGLLEIARQRSGISLTESNSILCNACHGRGKVRAVQATSLAVLRAIQDELAQSPENSLLEIAGNKDLTLHLLNERRLELSQLEVLFKAKIQVSIDDASQFDSFFIEVKPRETTEIRAALSSGAHEIYDNTLSNKLESPKINESKKNTGKNKDNNARIERISPNNQVNSVENQPTTSTSAGELVSDIRNEARINNRRPTKAVSEDRKIANNSKYSANTNLNNQSGALDPAGTNPAVSTPVVDQLPNDKVTQGAAETPSEANSTPAASNLIATPSNDGSNNTNDDSNLNDGNEAKPTGERARRVRRRNRRHNNASRLANNTNNEETQHSENNDGEKILESKEIIKEATIASETKAAPNANRSLPRINSGPKSEFTHRPHRSEQRQNASLRQGSPANAKNNAELDAINQGNNNPMAAGDGQTQGKNTANQGNSSRRKANGEVRRGKIRYKTQQNGNNNDSNNNINRNTSDLEKKASNSPINGDKKESLISRIFRKIVK